jgi:hypothetical protein
MEKKHDNKKEPTDSGVLQLGHGEHHVCVPLTVPGATAVWLKVESSLGDGCGQCPHNWLSWHLQDRHLHIHADIESNHAVVVWFAS